MLDVEDGLVEQVGHVRVVQGVDDAAPAPLPDDAYYSGLFRETISARRIETQARLANLEKSLAALKNRDGDFAHAHRRLIAMQREILSIITQYGDKYDR